MTAHARSPVTRIALTRRCIALCVGLIAAFTLLNAPPAAGQTAWVTQTSDLGAHIYGTARTASGDLALSCTAPSPHGRPLTENFENELHQTGPFEVLVYMHDPYFAWPATRVIDSAILFVGATGYRLPPFMLDELRGTAFRVRMSDPLIEALYDAPSLTLDTGQGTTHAFPVAGLGPALDAAMRYCSDRWVALGQPLPPALNRFAGAGSAQAPAPARAPQPASGTSLTPPVDARIRNGCNDGYTFDPRDLGQADLDSDGVPDQILDWGDVTCAGAMPRPFCGAANCSIDVFLSSRGGQLAGEFLGIGYEVVPGPMGTRGLRFGGTAGACARGECDFIFYWNGTEFVR